MAQSSTGGTLIKLALAGGAAYLAYEWILKPATSAAKESATPSTSAPSGGSVPSAPSGVSFNSLDQIYQRLAAAVGNTPYTADQFNFYLGQQLPSGKTPPDPDAVFTQAGFDRSKTMTLQNYWGAVAPYLKANMGLSGLGVFGSLAGARMVRG